MSESGTVAAEASDAIRIAIQKFRRLIEEGVLPEAASTKSIRDFSSD